MLNKTRLFIILSFGLLIILSCDDEKDPVTAEPPIFSATPVDISGPYDSSDSTFGDIKMVEPVIIPFGALLDLHRRSPAIEYYTRPGAAVLAVTKGVVEKILENPPDQGDYEILVTALPGSDYTIIYDHVLNLYVLEDVVVEPGDTLGEAGTWSENMRRTELQVNLGEGTNERSYCPLNFGDSAFVEQHRLLLEEYNNRGFTPTYDTLCLVETVQP